MSQFVIGIDAGGTGIRAVLADAKTGTMQADAHCVSRADGGPEVRELLAQLGQDVKREHVVSVCAGITKITRGGVQELWENELRGLLPLSLVEVVPDYVIAFHGAIPGGVGIAVVAGTGSVVYGDSGVGTSVRVGGRGWEWGDEGSGAWLTTEAIRRTIHARDGLSPLTPLNHAVEDFFATRDPAVLGEAARQKASQEGRGFLVPLLLAQANQGDAEAANLFVGAGGWLAAYARAAYSQLGFGDEETVSVATVGGLWEAGDVLVVPFERVLKRWHPNIAITPPANAPVVGAAERARRNIARPR